MAKASAPDPRFDPRFQRGYDGPEIAMQPALTRQQEPAAPTNNEYPDAAPGEGEGAFPAVHPDGAELDGV